MKKAWRLMEEMRHYWNYGEKKTWVREQMGAQSRQKIRSWWTVQFICEGKRDGDKVRSLNRRDVELHWVIRIVETVWTEGTSWKSKNHRNIWLPFGGMKCRVRYLECRLNRGRKAISTRVGTFLCHTKTWQLAVSYRGFFIFYFFRHKGSKSVWVQLF